MRNALNTALLALISSNTSGFFLWHNTATGSQLIRQGDESKITTVKKADIRR